MEAYVRKNEKGEEEEEGGGDEERRRSDCEPRSEETKSERQSTHVCRQTLEKKKTITQKTTSRQHE